MAKKTESVQDIANQLLNVRIEKAELNSKDRLLTAALKKHKDFKKQDLFKIEPSVSVVVTDKKIALEWAQKEAPELITVDATAARKLFAIRGMQTPSGFDTKLTDRLVQAGAKEEANYDVA